MLNDIFRSFFRTLGRIIAYLFVGYLLMLLFGQINAKAAITDDMYFVNYAGYINGAYVYNKSQYINNQPFSIPPNSGMAVTFDITFQSDKDLVGQNYILQVDTCSEISNYAGGSSPDYFTGDFVFGGHLSHKVQDLGSCQIKGYDAFLITDYYSFSILDLTVNSEEGGYAGNGKVGSSGGVYSPNYPISLQISNVSILDYDLSFINGLEQNNSQQETNDKLDDINDSINSDSDDTTSGSCGIICKLKGIFTGIVELPVKLVNLLIDALKSLFIPEDTDFITNFVESIESKLGFIAEVPVQIIEFGINLASAGWEEVTSVSLPAISIFGYNFWSSQEVDISEGLKVFQTFRYITDCLCVIICARGLKKLWENFTGGGNS